MTLTSDELVERLSELSATGMAAILARLVQFETINARSAYHEQPPNINALIESNELIHRLSGLTFRILNGEPESDIPRSVVEILSAGTTNPFGKMVTQVEAWMREAKNL